MQTSVAKKKIKLLPLLEQHRFELTAGAWHKWFPEEKYKLIIAMALNDCVQDKDHIIGGMYIDGYLIDKKKTYLVCRIPAGCIYRMLDVFYWRVREYIGIELKINNGRQHLQPVNQPVEDLKDMGTLFKRMPCTNEWLLILITGNKVETEYYSPALARLKKMIQRESFCSVINYQGGCGPVNLIPLKK